MMKAFTFSQLAIILLVILGLVVVVVIAVGSLTQAGSSLGEIGSEVGGTQVEIKLGVECMGAGGFCTSNTCDTNFDPNLAHGDVGNDCSGDLNCCARTT